MAEDAPTPDDAVPDDEQIAADEPIAEEVAGDQPVAESGDGEAEQPVDGEVAGDEPVAAPAAPESADGGSDQPVAEAADEDEPGRPRIKPSIPGADLEVDLVLEGESAPRDEFGGYGDEAGDERSDEEAVEDFSDQPVAATIDLAAGARYHATGKRKTAVARVILRPGTGAYVINGQPLDAFFPRTTLQRQIRQPLEAVGYEERMDVVARMHGGGVSSQAGALRHGISKALLEADPNLRGELKRRGFLTRDSRVKERKKAGLKKARKRPQFSKR